GPVYLLIHLNYPPGALILGPQLLTACFSRSWDYLIPVYGNMQPRQQVTLPLLFGAQSLAEPLYSTKVLRGLPRDVTVQRPGPVAPGGILPSIISLSAGQSQQFATTITGGVSWSRDPAVGTISFDALYTAPSF